MALLVLWITLVLAGCSAESRRQFGQEFLEAAGNAMHSPRYYREDYELDRRCIMDCVPAGAQQDCRMRCR